MASIIRVEPHADLPENPEVQELVHGGFRKNPYYQWLGEHADERHMGRDLLTRTTPLETADDACVDDIMNAANPVGTEDYQTSKWSK